MSWVAVAVVGATATYKIINGASQKHQANVIDKANPYPNQPVQAEYGQNVNQAQQMSLVGTPQQSYNNQLNQIQQNQTGALGALSRSANPGAGLASVVRQGDAATGNLNAQDAIARNRNLLNLLQQRQILAGQKDKAWDWNFRQKYLGNLAKANALRGAGNANINSGVNDIGGAAISANSMGAFSGKGGSTGVQHSGNVTTGNYYGGSGGYDANQDYVNS